MRLFLSVLVALSFLLTFLPPTKSFGLTSTLKGNDDFAAVARSVGRLVLKYKNKKIVYCTASLIKNDLILTAFSCIRDAVSIKSADLLMGYEKRGKADTYKVVLSPVESNETQGFVLLKVKGEPGKKWNTVPLTPKIPSFSNNLFMIDYPLGKTSRVSTCVAKKVVVLNKKNRLEHSCVAKSESFGAPIFDRETKTVLAFYVGVGQDGKHLSSLVGKIAQKSMIVAQVLSNDVLEKISGAQRVNETNKFRPSRQYTTVKVFYGTDRNRIGVSLPVRYGKSESHINYGSCDVTIPRTHKNGENEAPAWWRFELSENPKKHITLKNVQWIKKTAFFSKLKTEIENNIEKKALIFVHGYNETFESAAKRTGQMAYDLGFDGVPIFYSWPSQGRYLGYFSDANQIHRSTKKLKSFLKDFLDKSDAEKIYLIAHSMGNRGLTRAVIQLVDDNKVKYGGRFKEIILAAPDIDSVVFKNEIAPKIIGASDNVTLYVSGDDKALDFSRKFQGGYPRAGEAVGESIVIANKIETIDATGAGTSWLSHSYISSAKSIIRDLISLILDDKKAESRGQTLEKVDIYNGHYWKIKGTHN